MKYVTIINDTRFEIEIDKDGTLTVNGEPREVDFLALGSVALLDHDGSTAPMRW